MLSFKQKASRYLIKRASIMKRSFKDGDAVFYGTIRGILVGIFTANQATRALFFSHEQREGFQTRREITQATIGSYYSGTYLPATARVINDLIQKYFDRKMPSMRMILDQHRFTIVSLQDLKHMLPLEVTANNDKLIRQRHLYIKMATSYMKSHKTDTAIHRICQRIEEIQSEIEFEAAKITERNKTAFASYE